MSREVNQQSRDVSMASSVVPVVCSLCGYFSPTLPLQFSHLRLVHSKDPSFATVCPVYGCEENIYTFSGLNTHLYRHHRDRFSQVIGRPATFTSCCTGCNDGCRTLCSRTSTYVTDIIKQATWSRNKLRCHWWLGSSHSWSIWRSWQCLPSRKVLCRPFPVCSKYSLIHYCVENQGVVTYMSPIEVFATTIKFFDRQKVCLIAWSSPSEALDHLIFRSPWLIDHPLKRALITWFSFDPGCKCFYTEHISDYPLQILFLRRSFRYHSVENIVLFVSVLWWNCVLWSFQEPTEILLGKSYYVDRFSGRKRQKVLKSDKFYYVPLLDTIKLLLNNTEVLKEVLSPHEVEGDFLGDFCDGSLYKAHPMFMSDPQAWHWCFLVTICWTQNPISGWYHCYY